MPSKKERKALLTIPIKVFAHNTNEVSDKEDTFIVSFKSIEGMFYIGMKDAKAAFKIKTSDDIVKVSYPMDREFILEIHEKVVSEPIDKPKSKPTTLDSTTESATTLEAPKDACPICGLAKDICVCPEDQEKAED